MNLKLILVDDDIEMLQMMHSMLQGSEALYTVEGLAADGAQALALVREKRPDVLITDITMPQMDGLALIGEAKRLLPELKTVLITCHEEFQYAKEAIQLMVDEYLVKYTLTQEELLRCLEKLGKQLETQRSKKESLHLFSGEVYKNKEQFKTSYMVALVEGQTQKAQELNEKKLLYSVNLPQGNCIWAALFVDDLPLTLQTCVINEEKLLLFALMNITEEVVSIHDATCFVCLYEGQIYIVLSAQEQDHMPQLAALQAQLAEIQYHAQNALRVKPSALYLQQPCPVLQAREARALLQKARDAYFYEGGGVLKAVCAPTFAPPCRQEDMLETFRQSLFQPNVLLETLHTLVRDLAKKRCSPQHAKAVLEQLNLILDIALCRYDSRLPQIVVEGDTLKACVLLLETNIAYWVEHMGRSGRVPLTADIREMVRYVAEHLDTELNLEKVAAVIYKNSSYLSRLFKRETGLTFSEYLTQKRVEKAVWLLEQTTMSVEDIALSIGIGNTQYFYKFFKRETGKRPGDLRKIFKIKEETK